MRFGLFGFLRVDLKRKKIKRDPLFSKISTVHAQKEAREKASLLIYRFALEPIHYFTTYYGTAAAFKGSNSS